MMRPSGLSFGKYRRAIVSLITLVRGPLSASRSSRNRPAISLIFIVSKYPGATMRTSASGSSVVGGCCPSTLNGSAPAAPTSCSGIADTADALVMPGSRFTRSSTSS